MYELYKKGNEWQVHTEKGGAWAGSLKIILTHCVRELSLELDELEMAVNAMRDKDHNAAHFGVMGKFIYTFNKEFK